MLHRTKIPVPIHHLSKAIFLLLLTVLSLLLVSNCSLVFAPSSIIPRTVNPFGVTLNVKYGNIVAQNAQAYNLFVVYANGTIFFDNIGIPTVLAIFTVNAYSNGTLTLRWAAPVPHLIKAVSGVTPSVSSYNTAGRFQEVDYTTGTGVLSIDWLTGIRVQVLNGAFVMASFLSIIVMWAWVVKSEEWSKEAKLRTTVFATIAVAAVTILGFVITA